MKNVCAMIGLVLLVGCSQSQPAAIPDIPPTEVWFTCGTNGTPTVALIASPGMGPDHNSATWRVVLPQEGSPEIGWVAYRPAQPREAVWWYATNQWEWNNHSPRLTAAIDNLVTRWKVTAEQAKRDKDIAQQEARQAKQDESLRAVVRPWAQLAAIFLDELASARKSKQNEFDEACGVWRDSHGDLHLGELRH